MLNAVSVIRRQPQWRVIVEALKLYVFEMSRSERVLLSARLRKVRPPVND